MPSPGMESPYFDSTHEEVIKKMIKEKNYEKFKEEVKTGIKEEDHEQAKCEIKEETKEQIGENFKAVIKAQIQEQVKGESKEESRDELKEVLKRETVEAVDKVSADTPTPLSPISYLTPLPLDQTWDDPEKFCDDINTFLREHGYGIAYLSTPTSRISQNRFYRCDLLQPQSRARGDQSRQAPYQYVHGCPFRINAEFSNGSWGIIVLNATHNHEPSPPSCHPAQRKLERKKKRKAVDEMIDLNLSAVEIVSRVMIDDPGTMFDRQDVDVIRTARSAAKARRSRASRKVLLVEGPKKDTGDDRPKDHETPKKESDDEKNYKMPKQEMDDDELRKNPKKELADRNDHKIPKKEAIDELYKIPKHKMDDDELCKIPKAELDDEKAEKIMKQEISNNKDCETEKEEIVHELYKILKHTETELDVISNEFELWRRAQMSQYDSTKLIFRKS
ncbi:hypothetical protein N7490_001168 [Penicillium lividum]|nr:hypothetical protein N7490_001168 [Penicillium lividum]